MKIVLGDCGFIHPAVLDMKKSKIHAEKHSRFFTVDSNNTLKWIMLWRFCYLEDPDGTFDRIS
jgi:hypothetical protein